MLAVQQYSGSALNQQHQGGADLTISKLSHYKEGLHFSLTPASLPGGTSGIPFASATTALVFIMQWTTRRVQG